MLRRELLKAGISAAVGLIIGFFLTELLGLIALLLMPLYVVGTVYAIRHVLRICGAILNWFMGLMGLAVGTFNPLGCLFGILLTLVAIAATLSFTWVAGVIICIVDMVRAAGEDRSIPGRPTRPQPAPKPEAELPWRQKKSLPPSDSKGGDDPWGF